MSTFNKIFILIITLGLVGSMYLYTSGDFSFKTEKAYGSLLFSSNDNLESSNVINPSDTSFIATLAVLNNIKIDTSLFSSKLFLNLKDNSVVIDPALPGRSNPFAPINTN